MVLAEKVFQGDNLKGELKSDKERNVYKYLHEIARQDTCTESDFMNTYFLFFMESEMLSTCPELSLDPQGPVSLLF